MLAPMVDGEAIKLRKEVEVLRGEQLSLKQALKKAARERDKLQDTVDRVTSP